jgi:hypothetical protein
LGLVLMLHGGVIPPRLRLTSDICLSAWSSGP